jgi:peptidase M23-like protein
MRRLIPFLIAFFTLSPAAEAAWVWPVSGEVITPYRNGTDPYANGQHRGIDIGAPVGAAVVAAAGGEVRFAGTAGSSGLTISIRTGDGHDTSYLHLSSLAVRAGAHVAAGDRIGAVGTTGTTRSATSPHLHFGVRDAGTRHDYHDPLAFLPPPPPARAPDPPPAPAPATAPEPAPPAAAPVRVPRAAPEPRGLLHARPRAVPDHRPRTAPQSRPRSLPHAVRQAVPRVHVQAVPEPRLHPHPDAVRHPSRDFSRRKAPGIAGVRAAAHGRAPGASPALPDPAWESRATTAVTSSRDRRDRGDSGDGGFDLGWAVACAGLLLAAGLLGITGAGRGGAARRMGWAVSLAKWQGKTPNPARSPRG